MTVPAAKAATAFDPANVARQFVEARLAARALPDFPGPLPADMAAGYRVQEAAIGLWPEPVIGWKVGRIPLELQAELRAERVMGPVFAGHLWQGDPREPTPLPVIAGGFAAVEAEYIYRIGRDTPADKLEWTPDEALDYVEDLLVGVEFAASPLATINVLGPRIVASDFGNNAGLILGRVVPDWRARPDLIPPCRTYVEGKLVGEGSPDSIPGRPPGSLAFLLAACAARGRPLKAGQLVTTGAASGIHDIEAGQTARITFGDLEEIRCVAVPALPTEGPGGNTNDHRRRDG
ncbi:MAG: 2-keto-4-pentenoate hydratase [Alphaproteobacteria bacterium]|nr:2-keto-4-pentenoate hydratase [Alphaproteobacteria bacterium]MBU1514813.1 2-keto-4-pentenoate hydratase [Alphaproteobacteria bacterium]MBU2093944.1 2-keto-4-pentenoate hydratase [Alphaproteobacteria bacterium]MBU2153371.1 2-keto-4-pentenoate hydratase [Alphaproteobacteria bacterium]MBU2309799.1 2-keto-4-pentenoate hydratase [Alphaproteobacteria bacterium]